MAKRTKSSHMETSTYTHYASTMVSSNMSRHTLQKPSLLQTRSEHLYDPTEEI